MNDIAIRDLARLNGVSPDWTDHTGRQHAVSGEDLRKILSAIGVTCESEAQIADARACAIAAAARRDLPPLLTMRVGERLRAPVDGTDSRHALVTFEDGDSLAMDLEEDHDGYVLGARIERIGYHRLTIGDRDVVLAVAPARCFTVADIAPEGRLWGLTAQTYALRSAGDGGVGGFAGVEALAVAAALRGADALALSPTHALFSADPNHFSPYSPSTRLFRNPVHADLNSVFSPRRVAAAIESCGAAQEMAELEALALVDWPRASAVRARVLRALFADFRAYDEACDTALFADFRAFVDNGGAPLRDHAVFETLHAHHFLRDFTLWDWRSWPLEHRDPRSDAVAQFASDHADEVLHHQFLQWLAERSQSVAQRSAVAVGMRIGVIADLAVGMNAGGSHAWSRPQDLLVGLSVGAPPDPLAPKGQSWGLTALAPGALARTGYEPFLSTLREAMRHAGGVRIDHVMGLARLWIVPEGEDASHGAYIAYPFTDMLRLVALESHRSRAIVIGEDLGTVPHGFREKLSEAGVYGMRVMPFERSHDAFNAPASYPRDSVAMSSTHDLPTAAGWWRGSDLETRDRLEQFGPGQTRTDEDATRERERELLWSAYRASGSADTPAPSSSEDARAVDAAMAFLARTQSRLALAPVEDVIGGHEQPNLPGTTDEHPNWRRRYEDDARRMLDAPATRARLEAIKRERGV